jgi:O-methyltransferase
MKFLERIISTINKEKKARTKLGKIIKKMPIELSIEEKELIIEIKEKNLTMTSYERLCSTVMACKHAIDKDIPGDFVECGVWRGGNAILAAAILKLHKSNKKIYLFDTFEGMTAPTDKDKMASTSTLAIHTFLQQQREDHNNWCYASLEDVMNNFHTSNLVGDHIKFIKGDVLETLNCLANIPSSIAILRLDTDWYESTKKELEVLYPKLSIGGTLIIDDYGFWAGARQAVDEYFVEHYPGPLLQYIDNTGRMGIKFSDN